MAATTSYKAPINHEILRWARESVFVNVEKAAKTASVGADVYYKWELGEDFPTISKLRKLANLFKRPLPVFFMPAVPETPPIPKDFRKPATGLDYPLTRASHLSIRKARWYQSMARDLLLDLGKQLPEISQIDSDIQMIKNAAKEIRDLDFHVQESWKDNWEALKNWRQYLEEKGIFVFQFSMPINEVRGFSLVRVGFPPVIVINSKDSPNGRIFTLFHEYCHILLKETGICIPAEIESSTDSYDKTEIRCNEFSGNFLVPTEHLEASIKELSSMVHLDLIRELSKKFVVSRFVILRRLYSLKKINYNTYQRIFEDLQKEVKPVESAGGDFYKNQFAEKGSKFISLIVEAESGGTITTNKALEILGIKLKHYPQIVDLLYQ
jgi:Zn-dependent peptidase ImmA (M78 family)